MTSTLLLPIFSRSKKDSLFSNMILRRLILMLPWTSCLLMVVNADMAIAILFLAFSERFSDRFSSAPEMTEIQSMFSNLNFCYKVINCCLFFPPCVCMFKLIYFFLQQIPCSWKMFSAAVQERRCWRTTSSSSWLFPWQSLGQDFSMMAEMSFPNFLLTFHFSKSFPSDLLCT